MEEPFFVAWGTLAKKGGRGGNAANSLDYWVFDRQPKGGREKR